MAADMGSRSKYRAAKATAAAASIAAAGVGVVKLKELGDKQLVFEDLAVITQFMKIGINLGIKNKQNWTISVGLEEAAARFGDKEAIVFEDKVYSFNDLNQKANMSAWFFHDLGVRKGEVVALIVGNRPEFLFSFLGLQKVGAVAALINTSLKGGPLAHCLKVSRCTNALVGIECASAVNESFEMLKDTGIRWHLEVGAESVPEYPYYPWIESQTKGFQEMERGKVATPPLEWRENIRFTDPAGLIYTSGTTGLPKAAILTHGKLCGGGVSFSARFGIRKEDRIYNSGLPLFHSAGLIVGFGLCLLNGSTLVLRRKFSASNFWKDCVEYRCTAIQYIGELARYLIQRKPDPYEREHSVRIAVGNGMSREIWGEFQDRFNIPEVGEFYGATEGNVSLFNHCTDESSRGAVGRMGFLLSQLGMCRIVKFDREKEDVIRGPDGFCISAADGEVGEGIAEMRNLPAGNFDGYYGDKSGTSKKLLTNVFRQGDSYYRTGDLFMRNAKGLYYFIDRIGDTFRWKSENVSTSEVSSIVGKVPGVKDVCIYGVQLPGKEGRACCAAITYDDQVFSMDRLQEVCEKSLPSYACPLFVRILQQMDTTSTFKIKKVALQKEGVDPTMVKDRIFFMDDQMQKYVPLDPQKWNKIVTGLARL